MILESEEQTMELKNIQELNKEIFLIIRDIVGIKNVGVAFGSDFYTYYAQKKVVYSIIKADQTDKEFNECAKKNFNYMPKDSIDSFAISLLHELGHIETMKTFNKISIALDGIEKSIIQTFIDTDFDKKRVIAKTYYSLPTEYTATKWAVDWIRKHPNKYKVMLKRIEKALNDFYKINNIEG